MIENNNNSINVLNELIRTNYKNKAFYNKINHVFGKRIIDLFLHMPTDYINRHVLNEELNNTHIDKIYSIDLSIIKHQRNFHKRSPYTIFGKNKFDQVIKLIFFNTSSVYMKAMFEIGEIYRITGTINFFSNFYQIVHPENFIHQKNLHTFEFVEPIYNFNRNKINKRLFRNNLLFILFLLKL